MMSIKNAKIILDIKNNVDDICRNIIKKEKPPNMAPKMILSFEVFLFNIIDIPSSNIKSNKKFTKKT